MSIDRDRVTQLRISGLRAIRDLVLDCRGLTVLIGDNGTGKSSIIEALEILRQSAKPFSHVPDIISKGHGGLQSLLRRGASELRLGITIEGNGPRVDYDFSVAFVGNSPSVISERVDAYVDTTAPEPLHALIRTGSRIRVFDTTQRRLVDNAVLNQDAGDKTTPANSDWNPYVDAANASIGDQALALPHLGRSQQPAIPRLIDALGQIDVHVPFETRPLWQQKELDIRQGPRWPSLIESTDRLARYGVNLPNAFQQLRNEGDATWNRVIERARLGLGEDLRNFRLSPVGRGSIELELDFGAFPEKPLPTEVLSEGQISYLAFVALCELHSSRSLLAFDEPELHLHPALLSRVVWMLEEASQSAPVIVATHSDRLLDALAEPASAVVLCELDDQRAVRIRRPDPDRLGEWLSEYRGLGSIRAEGYEPHVFGGEAQSPGGTAER
ncbi:MAG: AAA family ATPase [Pseudomonadota bacterium]